jgi:hypothetical protein
MVSDGGRSLRVIRNAVSVYQLAIDAIRQSTSLSHLIQSRGYAESEDYDLVAESGRLLLPLDHPDSAHLLISGTGLTHLGSATGRDAMHRNVQTEEAQLTDSMRMFQWGLEKGKPRPGEAGVQPEWFYKGDGRSAAACGQALTMPGYALDGGEEAELVGLYVVGPNHRPFRVGFALGNEFSDHVMEKQNYLYLAHSKLRMCSYGPEVLVGEDLPQDLHGWVKVLRDDQALWTGSFLTGESNMSHSISNLEHHHFKYAQFRMPGDVHVHFFGTSTLSHSADVKARHGDVFEVWAPPFVRPLRNPLSVSAPEGPVSVLRL